MVALVTLILVFPNFRLQKVFFLLFNLLAFVCLHLCIARSSAYDHTTLLLPNTLVASATSFPLLLTPTFQLPSPP